MLVSRPPHSKVTISQDRITGTIVHPKATIFAAQGPIVIGSNCIIEEGAIILNRYVYNSPYTYSIDLTQTERGHANRGRQPLRDWQPYASLLSCRSRLTSGRRGMPHGQLQHRMHTRKSPFYHSTIVLLRYWSRVPRRRDGRRNSRRIHRDIRPEGGAARVEWAGTIAGGGLAEKTCRVSQRNAAKVQQATQGGRFLTRFVSRARTYYMLVPISALDLVCTRGPTNKGS